LFEPLDVARIHSALSTRWLGRACEHLATCGSTNDFAAARGRAGAPEGLVVITDEQTGGRGRLGRSWHATPGANLTFSVLLRPARPPVEVPPLTLLAGAAVAGAIAPFGVQPRLKWPNDVQLIGPGATAGSPTAPKKICGILTEMATEGDRVGHVVVGIGLNVNETALPPELGDRATSLALATGRPLDRVSVFAAVLAGLEDAYDDFRTNGPTAAVRRWAAYGAIGTRARVRVGEHDVEGVVQGLDPDGALRIAADDGRIHRVVSGEIT
jgi:BirA family biotin operon repressor/biotin-[acetyl-CoA-carboxylase] ligase